MNPYTIINIFNNVSGPELGDCWIAHYSKKEDAVEALKAILENRDEVSEDMSVETLFDELVENGYAYEVNAGSQRDLYFVRNEAIQENLDRKEFPFDDVDCDGK